MSTPSHGSSPFDDTTTDLRPSRGATAVPARSTTGASTGAAPGSTSSTASTARGQAASVASDAGDAGKHVAGVAKEQAADVLGETRRQASALLDQGRGQLREQSTAGQQRAASSLSSLAGELKDLADGKGGNGIATDLAHQASQRVDAVGSWLSDREPADVLREVEGFARRRPVAFLAIAAGVGLVAGRLTRGLSAAAQDAEQQAPAAGAPAHTPAGGAPAPVAAPVEDLPVTEWAAPEPGAVPAADDRAWDGRRR